MENINKFLERNNSIGSVLYYPGGGDDFGTMRLFAEKSSISTFYYADYGERITGARIIEKMGNDWAIVNEVELFPQFFFQNEWSDFWHNQDFAVQFGSPENAYGIKFTLTNKSIGKKCILFYLGTEAIKTYLILLNNLIKPDVIVIQDHGFGGNWGNITFGGGEDAKLYGISRVSNSLPQYLFVGENTSPWDGYDQVTEFEGAYGSAGHARALFKIIR